jgi:Cellulose binding domain/Cellulase (glycosyl hydrolase family 5)
LSESAPTLSARTRHSWRRSLLAAFAALVAVVAAVFTVITSPTAQAADSRDSFVTRCATHFCLGGKPYYFAGANTYDMFTYGFDWLPGEQYVDKVKIDAQMARLQTDGVTALRLWMFSHEDWQGFEAAKGVYTEEEFILFDYIMKSARDHYIRLIPVFENFWEAYGGIDTRLAWEGLPTGLANRWRFFNKAQCPGCFTQYKNYVKYALSRTNFFTGVKWINDPTVLAWELMNEPRYQDATPNENTTGTTLRAWVDEMGAYVKSLDPNHLLGTGMEGQQTAYGYGGDSGNPFVYIQQSPYIDFTSGHMYPTEGWAGLTFATARALLKRWIDDSHNLVGKPFFLGEWNASTDKSTWWQQMYAEMEASGGDGDAFWWFPGSTSCGGYDSGQGCPEHSVFRQHSIAMQTKSGVTVPTTPSTVPASTPPRTTPASTPPGSTPPVSTPPVSTPPRSTPPVSTPPVSTPPVSTPPRTTPPPSGGCSASYSVTNQWTGGFQAEVTVRNGGTTALAGWTVTWTFANGQSISQLWNGTLTTSGSSNTVRSLSWNGNLAPNTTTAFGFLATWTTTNPTPTLTCTTA